MSRRVLLLDEGFMSGAQAAVGLRNAGCQVSVLAATGGKGSYAGRDITWSLAPYFSTDEFLQAIDDVVRREKIEAIYPATEPIQQRVWNVEASWHDLIYPSLEPWQRELLRDKRRLSAFMSNGGVPIPGECDLPLGGVRHALQAFGMPAVVKGVRGRGGSATRIVQSAEAAEAAIMRLERCGVPYFLQRYIEGDTYLAGGVFALGVPLRFYTGLKRVQYPARTGPAAVIESLHDERLTEIAQRVFRLARVSGIASADFVRDRQGRYLFLELNPRPWGSMTAAAEAGVDLYSPLAELLARRAPTIDLSFKAGVVSTILPLYLLSARCWRSGVVMRSLAHDVRGDVWCEPGQVLHLLHRLYRVGRNWPAT